MTLVELNNYIKKVALAIPVVKDFSTDDVYESWNTGELKYGAVNFNVSSVDNLNGSNQFNSIIYYGDRLTDDRKNVEQVQNDAVTVLQSIVEALDNTDGFSVSYTVGVQLFEQKFADLLAGGYVNVRIDVKANSLCDFGDEVDFPGFPDRPSCNLKAEVIDGMKFVNSSAINFDALDFSKVKDCRGMFKSCVRIEFYPDLNTDGATDMSDMFFANGSLITAPKLNTKNVKSMESMFRSDRKLITVPLYDAGNLENLIYIFHDCPGLESVGGFKNLKVGCTNGFLESSKNITKKSLLSIIENLGVPDTVQSLKFGLVNLGKLTSDEIKIATDKGWELIA